MSKILVIEDEYVINKMICLNLDTVGHKTTPIYNGTKALELVEQGNHFDLAVVDIMLPGTDGFTLLKPLTNRGIPVIFLTAKGDLDSKLKGLTEGAEDYLVKPFEMPELLARISNILKRYDREDTLLIVNDIELDTSKRSVMKESQLILMTPLEFDLLLILMRHKNIALSRDRLLSEVWGILYEGESRTVDVHISQLRKKTELSIVSIPKIGYRLEEAQ